MKTIAIKWNTADVIEVRDDLTEDQADKVLEAIESHHDASVGINWDVISVTAEAMFPEARIKVGDQIHTPRFLNVTIKEVYTDKGQAYKDGYKEPTHYDSPDFDIYGKSLDMYHMTFAAVRK